MILIIYFTYVCDFFVPRREIPAQLQCLCQHLQAWLSPKYCTAQKPAIRSKPIISSLLSEITTIVSHFIYSKQPFFYAKAEFTVLWHLSHFSMTLYIVALTWIFFSLLSRRLHHLLEERRASLLVRLLPRSLKRARHHYTVHLRLLRLHKPVWIQVILCRLDLCYHEFNIDHSLCVFEIISKITYFQK